MNFRLAEADFIQKCKPNEVYYVGKLINKGNFDNFF